MKKYIFMTIFLVLTISLAACGGTAQTVADQPAVSDSVSPDTGGGEIPATEGGTVATVHTLYPGDTLLAVEATITDTNSSTGWGGAPGGDDYTKNIFERPFSVDMVYFPVIDITSVEVASDADFFYFNIVLNNLSQLNEGWTGEYGIEIDTDKDGRGDYYAYMYTPISETWYSDNCGLWQDTDDSVGLATPMSADTPDQETWGYDLTIFYPGGAIDPDAIFSRLNPGDGNAIQIAVHRSAIGSPDSFLFSAIADSFWLAPGWLDYNDRFTFAEAGSPIPDTANYPLKAVYLIDNTCRKAFGYTAAGNEPGLCQVAAAAQPPAAQPPAQPPASAPAQLTITITFLTDDLNNGCTSGATAWTYALAGAAIQTSCGSGTVYDCTTTSGLCGSFTTSAGNYCVSGSVSGYTVLNSPITISGSSGGSFSADFCVKPPG